MTTQIHYTLEQLSVVVAFLDLCSRTRISSKEHPKVAFNSIGPLVLNSK